MLKSHLRSYGRSSDKIQPSRESGWKPGMIGKEVEDSDGVLI